MTTAMGGWRRKAAKSGHSHTATDSRGAWSPVVRLGLPIQATGRDRVSAGSEFSCPRGQPAYILGGRAWGKRGRNTVAVSDLQKILEGWNIFESVFTR